jgi:hypothetical protein
MTLRRLPRLLRHDAHRRVISRMPSERRCVRCGCVMARHPEGYCTYHGPFGPTGCPKYRSLGDRVVTAAWVIALVVWTAALIRSYQAART